MDSVDLSKYRPKRTENGELIPKSVPVQSTLEDRWRRLGPKLSEEPLDKQSEEYEKWEEEKKNRPQVRRNWIENEKKRCEEMIQKADEDAKKNYEKRTAVMNAREAQTNLANSKVYNNMGECVNGIIAQLDAVDPSVKPRIFQERLKGFADGKFLENQKKKIEKGKMESSTKKAAVEDGDANCVRDLDNLLKLISDPKTTLGTKQWANKQLNTLSAEKKKGGFNMDKSVVPRDLTAEFDAQIESEEIPLRDIEEIEDPRKKPPPPPLNFENSAFFSAQTSGNFNVTGCNIKISNTPPKKLAKIDYIPGTPGTSSVSEKFAPMEQADIYGHNSHSPRTVKRVLSELDESIETNQANVIAAAHNIEYYNQTIESDKKRRKSLQDLADKQWEEAAKSIDQTLGISNATLKSTPFIKKEPESDVKANESGPKADFIDDNQIEEKIKQEVDTEAQGCEVKENEINQEVRNEETIDDKDNQKRPQREKKQKKIYSPQ